MNEVQEELAPLIEKQRAVVHVDVQTGTRVGMAPEHLRAIVRNLVVVRAIIGEKPDLTDQEVAWEFHRRTGRGVSRSSMNRVLLKLALSSSLRKASTRAGSSSSTRRAATSR